MEFLVALIKQVAPKVVSVPSIIHREALVAKKLFNQENNCQLADVISDVINIATAAQKNAISNRAFQGVVKEMEDEGRLVHHSEEFRVY